MSTPHLLARLAATLVVLAGLPAAAGAQTSLHVSSKIVQRDSASMVIGTAIRQDLTRLRAAQDTFYAANGTYAAKLAQLRDFRATSGATLTIDVAKADGWVAFATHPLLPGSEERIWVSRERAARPDER